MILIVGGSKDQNVIRLANAAEWRGFPFRLIYTDADPPPPVSWRPGNAEIELNGEKFTAAGISLFIRYDVFGADQQPRKAAFYDSIKGWAEACPTVGMLNRGNENIEVSKPRALVWAAEAGFNIPETWITTDFKYFTDKANYIAKPVAGGAYTKLLSDMEATADQPWIIQEKLNYPEVRLFRAGKHFFAFEITSDIIDYRTTDKFSMKEIEPQDSLLKAMQSLTDRLGLDYAAADFKTCPKTEKLLFMEINTMPMFTGYDDTAKGRLSDAMILTLWRLTGQSDSRIKTLSI